MDEGAVLCHYVPIIFPVHSARGLFCTVSTQDTDHKDPSLGAETPTAFRFLLCPFFPQHPSASVRSVRDRKERSTEPQSQQKVQLHFMGRITHACG